MEKVFISHEGESSKFSFTDGKKRPGKKSSLLAEAVTSANQIEANRVPLLTRCHPGSLLAIGEQCLDRPSRVLSTRTAAGGCKSFECARMRPVCVRVCPVRQFNVQLSVEKVFIAQKTSEDRVWKGKAAGKDTELVGYGKKERGRGGEGNEARRRSCVKREEKWITQRQGTPSNGEVKLGEEKLINFVSFDRRVSLSERKIERSEKKEIK